MRSPSADRSPQERAGGCTQASALKILESPSTKNNISGTSNSHPRLASKSYELSMTRAI